MGKGLFGYRAKDVQRLMADREAMLRLAQQQSQEVRARADQIQAELGRLQEEVAGRDRAIEALREEVRQRDDSAASLRNELAETQAQTQARIAEHDAQTQARIAEHDAQAQARIAELDAQARQLHQQLQEHAMARDSQQILMDELAPILRAAQESAQRIVERAEETGEIRTREAERMRADLSGAISQYVRWRQRLEGIMTSVQDRLDEAQSRIAEVPKRIQEALAPMSDAIYLFNEDLTTMSQVGDPPGQISPPAPQAAEPAAAQAPADDHIVLPEGQPPVPQPEEPFVAPPAPAQQEYVEPEGVDPSPQYSDEQTVDTSPRYVEDVGEAAEGDDSTGAWTRTGWS
jgi:multidrug efflux pump subunit AcrA (membrane-fusion protein)